MKLPLSELKPNNINSEIYSPTDLSDLMLSIKTHGQLEPIVINRDYEIISGHRRYYTLIQLEIDECEVRITDYENEIIALIEHNRHRVKTVSDIINETRLLEQELKKTLGGQGSRSDLKGKTRFNTILEISNTTGVSTTKLKQLKSIYNYEPELLQKIENKELSVNSAYKIVQDKYMKKVDSKVKNPYDKFKSTFKSSFREYKPTSKELKAILSEIYPYSLCNLTLGEIKPKLKNEREKLIEHMDFLKSLDNREIVIYKKLKDIEKRNFDKKLLKKIKLNIWDVKNIHNERTTVKEIENLEPELEYIDGSNDEFTALRVLIHSLEWVPNLGRLLKYTVRNKKDGRYLGIITIGSDVSSIGVRDNWIGWKKEDKFDKHRLNNTAIMTSCVPVSTLGFNFLGGKLIACLSTLKEIQNKWEKQYSDKLVGMTTTSLYGGFSQYNSIPLWHKMGETEGRIMLLPDDDIWLFWLKWYKKHHPEKYKKSMEQTGPKQTAFRDICSILNVSVKDYEHGHIKGVYFSRFYENTREFLRNEIEEKELILDKRIEQGLEYILNWWKPKGVRRYLKLLKNGKLNDERPLFYQDINENDVNSWLQSRGVKT